jgi:hypothetical protein
VQNLHFRTIAARSEPELVPQAVPRKQANLALALHSGWLSTWHLLSLDAPTVAAVWTVFIARCVRLTLPWESPAAMFAAVWMLYAADRLLDARPLPDGSAPAELEARHRFHHKHRKGFLCGIVAAALALAVLLPRMDAAALHLYCLLAALLAAWLLLIHLLPVHGADAHRLPKELAVGVCFPAAVFIPTVARTAAPMPTLLPSAIFLGIVCTLNCLFIYAWEHPDLRSATWSTRWAAQRLAQLTAAVIAAAVVAAWLGHGALRPIAAACALSAALLEILNLRRTKMNPVNLRAAADLSLLTPSPVFLMLLLLNFYR